jgi:hypothetical protein
MYAKYKEFNSNISKTVSSNTILTPAIAFDAISWFFPVPPETLGQYNIKLLQQFASASFPINQSINQSIILTPSFTAIGRL